ncbi:spore germination protein [Paenibacillus sp. CGMCC 1.16610]|uniref:Spore germination protein n=1 Tax=Paenibacillus anseongense TaxID=2682845 RepID=A0ABW9UI61_9BACL|nr:MULTISPECIES: spore germination protein [Paenibacillus]MBA2943654.1 spore germination protein [Paenibacillus sp. CGMCC 1.16610]MVQ37560.1 spore germination protein [Paenibacillus anseongense]
MDLLKLFKKNKPPVSDNHVIPSNSDAAPLSFHLAENQAWLEQRLADCSDVIYLSKNFGPNLANAALIVYCDSLINDKELIYFKDVLEDLVFHDIEVESDSELGDAFSFFEHHGVTSKNMRLITQLTSIEEYILNGYVLIFFDQWDKALSFNALSIDARQISEPLNEPVVRGPQEATVENMRINLGMLRNRLKSSKFKILKFVASGETHTEVVVGYLEGAVNPETLTLFKTRFDKAIQEEILEVAYIEELIEDSTYSPFPQYRHTERTDTAVAALLDGKIIVLTSGSPSIMICPGLFVEFFSSSEDYYIRSLYTSLIRLLRLSAFIMALTLPSLYIAISTFHSELIPTVLLLAIIDTREGIPFPAFIEALLMEFFFEIMREAGIRLPRPVGSAVSIVGALVIGQAAIEAKIASPIMVIIVALTGIASFSLPNYNMAIALRILRFPLMLLAATLGGFGFMIGFLFIFLHLVSLRSLGQPYLAPWAPLRVEQLKDGFLRFPLKILLRSPRNRHMHRSPRK